MTVTKELSCPTWQIMTRRQVVRRVQIGFRLVVVSRELVVVLGVIKRLGHLKITNANILDDRVS